MNNNKVEELVSRWTQECIADSDIDLVDVEYTKEGKDRVLRIFIDKSAGVDIDDCQRVSTLLSDKLDKLDPIPHSYSLEVSSPGLESPLKKSADYERNQGKLVNIKTFKQIEGQKEFQGILVGLNDGIVELELKDSTITIPIEQIAKARLAVEF